MSKAIILKDNFPLTGKIDWIGLRHSSTGAMKQVNTAELLKGHGLVGDKAGAQKGGKRQITLIQAEHLPVITSFLKRPLIYAEELRRNLVISEINIGILKGYRLKINHAVIEITGNCAPCAKMEHVLGFGGYNAMRNHGGVTATVIHGGIINVGDEMQVLDKESAQQDLL